MPGAFETSGFVSGGPKALLRLEGAALLAAALFAYGRVGGGWPMFALLFLVPDLSLFAYFAGPRVGAFAYNALHSTIGPLAYGALGAATGDLFVMQIAVIHLAHIGFDRALGFGLKYGVAFGDTHLGRIGRGSAGGAG